MKRLINFGLSLVASLTMLVAVPVVASAQPDIVGNLCKGANLDINSSCSNGGNITTQFNHVIRTIVNTLSLIVGIVAVVMIMIGGFRYITSGGSDASVTSAKNTILYAVIGLIIVSMAQLIVHFVVSKLNNS